MSIRFSYFKKSITKTDTIFLVIVFLLAINGSIINYMILKEDSTYFIYDILTIYQYSSDCYGFIKKGDISGLVHNLQYNYLHDYPPFIVFQAIPFYFIFNLSEDSAALSNIIHIFIILFSTYFIGRKLKNSYAGILSVCVLFFIPGFQAFSRVYLPVFALTSMVTLTIVLFLYNNFFQNTPLSIIFGLSLGFGMLSKYTYLFYIIPLLLIWIFRYYKRRKNNQRYLTRTQIRNILLLILLFGIVVLLWYPKSIDTVIKVIFTENEHLLSKNTNILDYWYKNARQNIFLNLHSVLLKIFIYPTIISIFYMIVTDLSKKIDTRFKISDLILGMFIAFLVFLNFTPDTRLLLPFIPSLCVIIGVTLFDFYNLLLKIFIKKKLLASGIKWYFLFYILILVFLMSSYWNHLIDLEIIKKNENHEYFFRGMVIPIKSQVKPRHIATHIDFLLNRTHNPKILFLTLLPLTDALDFYLKHEQDLEIFKTISYIIWEKNESKLNYIKPKLISKSFICNYDIIIDSPNYIRIEDMTQLRSNPIKLKMIKNIRTSWNQCRLNYELNTSYPIKVDNINTTLDIYLKKF